MRWLLAVVLCLAIAQLLAACNPRDFVGGNPTDDARRGAAVGGAIGGPEGAVIGTLTSIAIGIVVRSLEKRRLRRRGLLTDRIARPTAHRASPPNAFMHDPSGQYPQQTLPPTDNEPLGR